MKSVSVTPVLEGSRWKKNGTQFYRIRITYNRESRYIKTHIAIHQDQLGKNGRIKDADIRIAVEDTVRGIEKTIAAIPASDMAQMTAADIVSRIERMQKDAFALDFVRFGKEVAGKKTRTSCATYLCALRSLCEYMGSESFDISVITSSSLHRWEDWLRAKYGADGRAVSAYTAAIRYIHNQARLKYNDEEMGHVPIRNPFAYYRPPQQKQASHRAVDESVIRRMIELRPVLKGRERMGVDVFLISFALMGMNSPDLYNCAPPKDGIITYNRAKTAGRRQDRAVMKVRLEPEVMPLLSEYLSKSRTNAFRFHEMYTTYEILGANVNAGLRAFCKRIGHTSPVTLYGARHSWASIAYKAHVDRGIINDCLCHVDKAMKVTDIYIDKDWSVMWDANRKVLEQFSQQLQ